MTTYEPDAAPSAIVALQEDAPVVVPDDYEFGAEARRYIDSQAREIQAHLLAALLLGKHCSWFAIDPGSPTLAPGKAVCSASSNQLTVTLALTTPLASAGLPLGAVVTLGTGPLVGMVLVALDGVIPATISGLSGSSGGYANVDPTTGNIVEASSQGTYPIGMVDGAGNVTLRPMGNASSGVSASGLFLSIVDCVVGSGTLANNAGSRTQAVGFGTTQAGHFCTGARGYWDGPAATLKVSLWSNAGTRVATTTVAVTGAGIFSATFTSAVALTPGEPYAIAVWETTGSHYTTYSGLSGFLPSSGGNGTTLAGPFAEFCGGSAFAGFTAISDVYGLYAAGDAIPTSNDPTNWSAIEPVLR